MIITLGVDAHKRTHTIVAVDGNGKQIAQTVVPATSAGHLRAFGWATRFEQRRWAIEDCRPVTRRLERELLSAGEVAVRVPPKLMAQARRSVRTPGKSDPIDGLAIARAALRHDDLPEARLEGDERIIRILSDRREALVAERTRLVCRLRWSLHELDPMVRAPAGSFNTMKHVTALIGRYTQWSQSFDPIAAALGEVGLAELTRVEQLNTEINTLKDKLEELTETAYPHLLDIVGVAPVTAAALIGHIGNIDRFATENKFASLVGTAPIPVSSGNSTRVRLNQGGDRHLNAVIYRIAITQLAHHQPAKDLVDKTMARGKTKKEAIRILKRHITRAIYTSLTEDQTTQHKAAA